MIRVPRDRNARLDIKHVYSIYEHEREAMRAFLDWKEDRGGLNNNELGKSKQT